LANDLNKVMMIGRLVRDPEFKQVNDSSVVNFTLANGRTYSSQGQKKEETGFFDCVAWGKLADIIKQYTAKGKQIAVEGRLQFSSWETPEGKKASKVRIFVENMQLLGNASGGGGGGESAASRDDFGQSMPEPDYNDMGIQDDEDIPF